MAWRARHVISASTHPPPMVPTMRPSAYTTILAPAFCGVEPSVEIPVTRAAFSPVWVACSGAAKTSFIARRIADGRSATPRVCYEVMRLPIGAFLVVAARVAGSAAAEAPAISHAGVGCVVAEKFPRLEARTQPTPAWEMAEIGRAHV